MFIITIFNLIFFIIYFNEILIKKVKDFINNNSQLTKIFTHHKVKYPIDDMLKNILIILKTGISYIDIQKHTFINWNTIYKFNLKLIKYNIFEKISIVI